MPVFPPRPAALAVVVAVVVAGGALGAWTLLRGPVTSSPGADPDNPAQVAVGRAVYARACAACHGADLEGQPDWRQRGPDGALPAPPHDASGHTWHHPDAQLYAIIAQGITPFAPPGYVSTMPAFAGQLSEAEIWAVLAYIKSRWPADIRALQAERSSRPGG